MRLARPGDRAFAALAVLVLGCGTESTGARGAADAAGAELAPRSHRFADLSLAAGSERTVCASWTLGNEEVLFVRQVDLASGPGFHHSNWFFFDDDAYEGPDGVWPCRERGYDTVSAAVGGGVVFAQSTQAREETQAFGPGSAVRIPPRSKIVGELHMLNASGEDYDTDIELTLSPLAPSGVETQLLPLALQYADLAIPPQQRSEFRTACDLSAQLDDPLDFRLHHVLPHYHELGTGMSLRAVGGERDGELLFERRSAIGEPLGQGFDPPLELAGMTGLELGCRYDNPRDETVGTGIGDQEMCILFAFTDSPVRWIGSAERGSEHVGDEDGVAAFEAPCTLLSLPPWK